MHAYLDGSLDLLPQPPLQVHEELARVRPIGQRARGLHGGQRLGRLVARVLAQQRPPLAAVAKIPGTAPGVERVLQGVSYSQGSIGPTWHMLPLLGPPSCLYIGPHVRVVKD